MDDLFSKSFRKSVRLYINFMSRNLLGYKGSHCIVGNICKAYVLCMLYLYNLLNEYFVCQYGNTSINLLLPFYVKKNLVGQEGCAF